MIDDTYTVTYVGTIANDTLVQSVTLRAFSKSDAIDKAFKGCYFRPVMKVTSITAVLVPAV